MALRSTTIDTPYGTVWQCLGLKIRQMPSMLVLGAMRPESTPPRAPWSTCKTKSVNWEWQCLVGPTARLRFYVVVSGLASWHYGIPSIGVKCHKNRKPRAKMKP